MPIPDERPDRSPGDRDPAEARSSTRGEQGEGAHWLPDGASVVALVRERGGGAWASGVAVGLADIVGRRRGRTFLANTIPGASELDGLMEATELPGLTRALAGETSVSAIARSAPRQSFAYLPAGTPALPLSRLREIPAFRSLLRRVAERGGTLLLYVAEEALDEEGGPDPDRDLPVDGCIAIGNVEDLALVVGAPLLARVERPSSERTPPSSPEPDADAAAESHEMLDGQGPDGPPPARKGRVPAWAPWIGVAAGLALAWVVWGMFGGSGAAMDPAPQAGDPAAALTAEEGSEADARSAGNEAVPATPTDPAGDGAMELEFSAPAVPYSVLLASFALVDDAERHLREINPGDQLVIVAATPIRGRTYYRILAGAREDRLSAEQLMRELVEAGIKEQDRAWDVRPVRYAFELGTFSDRRDADRRVEELREAAIPAYALEGGDDPDLTYRVYAGAYESEQAAEVLGMALEEAGESARLVTRRGRAR